jgi:ribosomal protein S28E/S33
VISALASNPSEVIMRSSLLAAALLVLTVTSAPAADLLEPDPGLTPAEVVETQLTALQTNDTPETDAGIAQTWAFAHPNNKRMTGPLPRFAQMIKGPLYRVLLDHRAHEVEEIGRTDDEVVFGVIVTGQNGDVVIYQWKVGKVPDGEDAGAWMTTAVSPPVRVGDAI